VNIGLGNRRRTILLIDADAQARKTLRLALEAAEFSVGEAACAHEGERTALRIKPDAILAEPMTDPVDHGMTLGESLRASGSEVPYFIVSTAGEALIGGIGLHELGVAGVFLKPIDVEVVVQTLRTRLGMRHVHTAVA
jgi:DNA-binding response OmpR family regulator